MTSTWGNWHGSWQRSDAEDGTVADAAEEEDSVALAKWLAERDFTLIDEGLRSEDGSTAALVLDIDDHPAVVAFTSLKYANAFAGEQPELFDDPKNIKGFVVEGRNVVLNLPKGSAILIDPGSDDEHYLEPGLVDRIRAELTSSGN